MGHIADLSHGIGSLARRGWALAYWQVDRRIIPQYAKIRRSRLDGVTFVGITGSAGKTSAKVMIAAVLKAAGSVTDSPGTANRIHQIARVIIATRRSDAFCVLELSAEYPGCLDRPLKLVRPAIGIVTTVGEDHLKAFGSREAIAAEKGNLIAALPSNGTAVLNADDPLVWAMGAHFRGRIVSYGQAEGADLQARDIRAAWPERLSFTVRYRDEDHPVQTQLCGGHWITSTLAALATGVAVGIPLADAASAVSQVPPFKARMEPVTTADGITFLRDDWKGSFWGMRTVFDFLRDAEAERKVIVLGTLADYHGTVRNKYQAVGQEALKVADVVIFVGKMATYGLRAQKFASGHQSLMAFPDIGQASAALQELLRPGDLVLLKGSGVSDHLGRLYHARTGPVACWRMDCAKNLLCDDCQNLRPKQAAAAPTVSAIVPAVTAVAPAARPAEAGLDMVFVGIGNPGERYSNTPHNVGFAVVDILAERHGLTWQRADCALIATVEQRGKKILLVKPQQNVNNTGKSLVALSKAIGFSGKDCVLVQDDIHLPIGKVRTRLRGSDGGHLGVRSALVAFQTSDICRIKVGVAAADSQPVPSSYFISPFMTDALAKVNEACVAAADRLQQLAEM